MRRSVWILATCLAFTTEAHAAKKSWEETCVDLGDLARAVMSSRQKGREKADLLKSVADNPLKPFTVQLIDAAFKEPRFEKPEGRKMAISEFQKDAVSQCLATQ